VVTVVLAVVPTAEAGDTPMNDKPVSKRAEHAPTDTTLAIAERTDWRPPSRLIIFITDLPLSLGQLTHCINQHSDQILTRTKIEKEEEAL
jgi:hypothetical protein